MPISQGLKAGLAAGVIYGAMIGLLHLGTLETCSSTQIGYISQQLSKLSPPSNQTATDLFSSDVGRIAIVNGIWALIYGILFGLFFGFFYSRLPGSNSKRKGMTLTVPVFLIGIFLGPAALFVYDCNPSFVPIIFQIVTLPVSFVFGYVLGVFYDSFGRLAVEERENEKVDKSKSNP